MGNAHTIIIIPHFKIIFKYFLFFLLLLNIISISQTTDLSKYKKEVPYGTS